MDNKYITLSHLDQTVWSLVQRINQIKDSIEIEETDPVFLASAASQITSGDIQKWNNKLEESDLPDLSSYMMKGTDYVTAGQESGTTLGSRATAEGEDTTAEGDNSHAEGYKTTAEGISSHAEGTYVISIGGSSHAEGGAVNSVTLSAVTGSGTSYTTTSSLYYYYLGKRIIHDNIITYITSIDQQNKAFTVKTTFGALNNTACTVYLGGCSSLGAESHAEGIGTTSEGENSHAEGRYTVSGGQCSHAEGTATIAKGYFSHAEGGDAISLGNYSHAEGSETTSKGMYSHAEGASTIATNDYSHAEGSNTTSIGSCSHAEGYSTISRGNCSHAEGYYTTSIGIESHAEGGRLSSSVLKLTGSGTSYTATGTLYKYYLGKQIKYINVVTYITAVDIDNSTITVDTTFGELSSAPCTVYTGGSSAKGYSSHAEGTGTVSQGNYSHAEGQNTISQGDYSHAEGLNTLSKSSGAHSEGINTVSIGTYSHAEGYYTISAGSGSHAEGGGHNTVTLVLTGSGTSYTTTATIYRPYLGKHIAYGNVSTYITSVDTKNKTITVKETLGELNSKSCTIETGGSSALGIYSHAEGYQTASSGESSHAEGTGTISAGKYSHTEGYNTISSGESSHAEGSNASSYGKYSHAEGSSTTSIGIYSHAEGGTNNTVTIALTGSGTSYTTASTLYYYYLGKQIAYGSILTYITSIDVNNKTITVETTLGELNSNSCTLYGSGSSAFGAGSHAEGLGTTAQGERSHTEGQYTIACGDYQHAAGKYNALDTNNTYAEIIGIGTSDSVRRNGRTLDWSGNEVLAGKLTVGAGPTANMDVATKLYVDTIITVEPMSNVQAMLTELGLDASASLTPATVPAQTNHAIVQEG